MKLIYRYQPNITAGPGGTDPRPSAEILFDLATLDGYRYISVDSASELAIPDGITLEPVTLTNELREQIKLASPICQLIEATVVDQIRKKYSLNDELYFARISVGALKSTYQLRSGESEILDQYQLDVETARAWGEQSRSAIGL